VLFAQRCGALKVDTDESQRLDASNDWARDHACLGRTGWFAHRWNLFSDCRRLSPKTGSMGSLAHFTTMRIAVVISLLGLLSLDVAGNDPHAAAWRRATMIMTDRVRDNLHQ
jgi:hypothetical protein